MLIASATWLCARKGGQPLSRQRLKAYLICQVDHTVFKGNDTQKANMDADENGPCLEVTLRVLSASPWTHLIWGERNS